MRDVSNSSLPALLFHGVFPLTAAGKSHRFRQAFRRNGWAGLWTDTICDYTHFHSNAHEALGIAEGKVTVKPGAEGGLEVIGAYPPGQSNFDMKRKGRAVPRVPLPSSDPFYGDNGPVVRIWKMSS